VVAAIAQGSPHQATAAPQPRLVHAAHEFEAQLMKELFKPLTAGDDDEETGSAGALGDYAGEALGRALSDHGGFGIADRIIAQVSQSGNRPASAPVIENHHFNNGSEAAK
jgi:Rod binding domain-containing protein